MIDVQKVLSLQKAEISEWHEEITNKEESLPWKFIEENNQYNFKLWHEEDIARIREIDPLRIVEAKRNIDQYNQARNNAMEKIDEWTDDELSDFGRGKGGQARENNMFNNSGFGDHFSDPSFDQHARRTGACIHGVGVSSRLGSARCFHPKPAPAYFLKRR